MDVCLRFFAKCTVEYVLSQEFKVNRKVKQKGEKRASNYARSAIDNDQCFLKIFFNLIWTPLFGDHDFNI